MRNIKKHHCMVVHAYYPIGETRVQRESEILVDNGYEVDVICLQKKGEPPRANFNGVNIYRLPVKRHKGSGLLVQIFEYFSFFFLSFLQLTFNYFKKHYKIIQVHNLPDFLVFITIIPKLFGAKIIIDIHDLMPEFFVERFNRSFNSLPVRLLFLQEKLACHYANHIITVTDLWRKTLIKRGNDKNKLTVIMNIADQKIFKEITKKSTANNNEYKLVYHGTFAKRYGLDMALDAINIIRKRIPNIHLTLIGAGEYLNEMKEIINENNLNKNIDLSSGFVPVAQLPKLLSLADIGLILNKEGAFTDGLLPTKLLEYAALGIPVISSRTSCISSYFDDSMLKYFQPGSTDDLVNCIIELYENRAQLQILSKNIKKINDKYNWKVESEKLLTLMDHLSES